MSKNNYLLLYQFSKKEYKPYFSSTIEKNFVLDPIINKEQVKQFVSDTPVDKPKKEFVLDPQFPQYKLGSNGETRTHDKHRMKVVH